MATLIRVERTQADSTTTIPGRVPAGTTTSAWIQAPAVPASVPVAAQPYLDPALSLEPVVGIERRVRRSITPLNGMALEKLSHAIEYLTDEYAFEVAVTGSYAAGDPALQAVQLLMSLNRQVYFECPVVEPLTQRIFSRLFPEQPQPSSR